MHLTETSDLQRPKPLTRTHIFDSLLVLRSVATETIHIQKAAGCLPGET